MACAACNPCGLQTCTTSGLVWSSMVPRSSKASTGELIEMSSARPSVRPHGRKSFATERAFVTSRPQTPDDGRAEILQAPAVNTRDPAGAHNRRPQPGSVVAGPPSRATGGSREGLFAVATATCLLHCVRRAKIIRRLKRSGMELQTRRGRRRWRSPAPTCHVTEVWTCVDPIVNTLRHPPITGTAPAVALPSSAGPHHARRGEHQNRAYAARPDRRRRPARPRRTHHRQKESSEP